MRIDYYLGLHFARQTGHSAFALLEQTFDTDTRYLVVLVEQFPAGTPYADVVERLEAVYKDERIRQAYGRIVVVDKTLVGSTAYELFRGTGIGCGFYEVPEDGQPGPGRVSIRNLISAVQRLIRSERLRLADGLTDMDGLTEEFKTVRAGGGVGSHSRFAAIALGCWHAEWWKRAMRDGGSAHAVR